MRNKLKGAISPAKTSLGMASLGEGICRSHLSWSRAHRWVGSDQPSWEPTKDTLTDGQRGRVLWGQATVYDDNNKSNRNPRLKSKKQIQHRVRIGPTLDGLLDMPGSLTRPPPLTLTPADGWLDGDHPLVEIPPNVAT